MVIRTIRKRAVRHLELIQLHSNHLCIEPSDFKVQELLLNGRNYNAKINNFWHADWELSSLV